MMRSSISCKPIIVQVFKCLCVKSLQISYSGTVFWRFERQNAMSKMSNVYTVDIF